MDKVHLNIYYILKVHCLPFNNSICPSEKILPVGTTTGVPEGGTVIMAPLVLELNLKLVSLKLFI